MNKQTLKDTIQQLFAGNKGLLAMDESAGTCNKRFAAAGIPQTMEMRRKYLELIAGTENAEQNTVEEVAEATVNCLLASVPAAMPAIVFLSGGQSPEEAAAHLNAIHTKFKNRLPWIVSFSFARAIQQPALEIWKGQEANVEEAQKLLYKRAKLDAAARQGEYNPAIEKKHSYGE